MRFQKISILLLLLIGAPNFSFSAEIFHRKDAYVLPEIATVVELSNTDVNRFVCRTPIRDIVHSNEKGVIVQYTAKDTYLKFEIIKKGTDLTPAYMSTELFITCDNQVFHVIAKPVQIPARTVHLSSGSDENLKQNRSYLKDIPLEQTVQKLIKAVYTDSIPQSFTVKKMHKSIKIYRDLSVTLVRTIYVDGEGFIIKEYILRTQNVTIPLVLSEADFLHEKLTRRPVGMTIDTLSLAPGASARMIIIERKGGR